MRLRLVAPGWGQLSAFVMALVCVVTAPVSAQPRHKGGAASVVGDPKDLKADKADKKKDTKPGPPKTYDFNALDLNGRMRTPQLLYFLERANEELERASLEKRSFIPHITRSLEEEAL